MTESLDLPPIIHPGQKLRGVKHVKRVTVNWINAHGSVRAKAIAAKINRTSSRYDAYAVRAVRYVQRQKRLKDDGVIGPATYAALGIPSFHIMPRSLRGIPWVPGLRRFDGNWIPEVHHPRLIGARRKGWRGPLNSAHRPDWYQARLFQAAIIKYGSEAAARRWVAPPGRSNHRHADSRCAIDTNDAAGLRRLQPGWYQPMSWEPWHSQWRSAYTIATGAIDKVLSVMGSSKSAPVEPEEVDNVAVVAGINELLALFEERGEGE